MPRYFAISTKLVDLLREAKSYKDISPLYKVWNAELRTGKLQATVNEEGLEARPSLNKQYGSFDSLENLNEMMLLSNDLEMDFIWSWHDNIATLINQCGQYVQSLLMKAPSVFTSFDISNILFLRDLTNEHRSIASQDIFDPSDGFFVDTSLYGSSIPLILFIYTNMN